MKKWLSVLMAFCMLFALAQPLASAEGNPTVTVESVSMTAGADAVVKVSISNNPGLAALKIRVSYPSALELKAAEQGDIGGQFKSASFVTTSAVGNWNILDGTENVTGDGVLASLTFALTDSAAAGTYDITVAVEEAYDANDQDITFETVKGVVTVNSSSAQKVTVTFDANGGAFGDGATSKDVEIDKGATVTLPAENPTRDGYDFIGWFASADAQNVFDFDAGINADATVYAGWKEIPVEQVSVTFHANGGAFGYGATTTVVQIDKGATVTAPTENPTRDGYNFTGWFTAANATTAFDFNAVINADTTVYAGWSEIPAEKVKVTFNGNGGTPVTTQVEIDKGAKVTAPAENPTRDNYDFNGWFSDPDAKTAFDFSAAIAADTTVYAGWKETEVLIEYVNVTFNANGGAFGDDATAVVVIDKGQLVTAPAENPTRNGYNFNGWFAAADAKTPFDFSKAIYADTVVYAGWEEIPAEKVKVTFDGNGGLPEKTEREIDKGATVTAPANPTRSGYSFTGWFSDKNASTKFDFSKAVDANTTVYAGWSKNETPTPTPDGCYIATSVYGSYDCPEVWTLRRFRDDVLGSTWYGRLFIKAYYATSPTLVKWFGDADWFRNFWRDRLDDMVRGLQDDGFESTPYQDQDWRS